MEVKGKWLYLLSSVTGNKAYSNSTSPIAKINLETYEMKK